MPNILGTPTTSVTNGTSIDVTMPSGIVVGERLYVAICQRNNDPIQTPTGWTLELTVSGTDHSAAYFYRVADGLEGATQTFQTTKFGRWAAVAFRTDAAGIDVSAISATAVSATSVGHPQVTTTVANALVVNVFYATSFDGTIYSDADFAPPGTVVAETNYAVTNAAYVGVATFVQSTAGLTPPQTSTCVPSARLTGATIALYSASSINSVNGGSDVENGQQNVNINHSLSGTITSVTIKATDGASLNYSQSASFTNTDSSNTTFNIPDISAITTSAAGIPFTSATFTVSVEITDGTDTASADFNLVPSTGYAVVSIASPVTGIGYFLNGVTGAIDDDQIFYPTAYSTVISADSGIQTDYPYGQPITGQIFDQTSGNWLAHSVVFEYSDARQVTIPASNDFSAWAETIDATSSITLSGTNNTTATITAATGERCYTRYTFSVTDTQWIYFSCQIDSADAGFVNTSSFGDAQIVVVDGYPNASGYFLHKIVSADVGTRKGILFQPAPGATSLSVRVGVGAATTGSNFGTLVVSDPVVQLFDAEPSFVDKYYDYVALGATFPHSYYTGKNAQSAFSSGSVTEADPVDIPGLHALAILLNEGDSYFLTNRHPDKTPGLLDTARSGNTHQKYNDGFGGDSFVDIALEFDSVLDGSKFAIPAELFTPSCLILGTGGNGLFDGRTGEQILGDLDVLIAQAEAAGIENIVLVGPPPFKGYASWNQTFQDRHDVYREGLGLVYSGHPVVRTFNLLESQNQPFYLADDAFGDPVDYTNVTLNGYGGDGLHTNDDGQQVLAAAIVDFLQDNLFKTTTNRLGATCTIQQVEPIGAISAVTVNGVSATSITNPDAATFTFNIPTDVNAAIGSFVDIVATDTLAATAEFKKLLLAPASHPQYVQLTSTSGADVIAHFPGVAAGDVVFYNGTANRTDAAGTCTVAIDETGAYVFAGAVAGGTYEVELGWQDASDTYAYNTPVTETITIPISSIGVGIIFNKTLGPSLSDLTIN